MKTFYRWIKSKAATISLVFGAIVLALAAARSTKRKASAQRKEDKVNALLSTGISTHQAEASKLIKSADKDKKTAAWAQADLEIELEKLCKANADIDSIANNFNSVRMRRAG